MEIGRDWEGEEGRDALLVGASCTLLSSSSRLEERNREGEERTRRLLMIPMAAEVLRVQGKKDG